MEPSALPGAHNAEGTALDADDPVAVFEFLKGFVSDSPRIQGKFSSGSSGGSDSDSIVLASGPTRTYSSNSTLTQFQTSRQDQQPALRDASAARGGPREQHGQRRRVQNKWE